jgi:hypothetical protein
MSLAGRMPALLRSPEAAECDVPGLIHGRPALGIRLAEDDDARRRDASRDVRDARVVREDDRGIADQRPEGAERRPAGQVERVRGHRRRDRCSHVALARSAAENHAQAGSGKVIGGSRE